MATEDRPSPLDLSKAAQAVLEAETIYREKRDAESWAHTQAVEARSKLDTARRVFAQISETFKGSEE